MVHEKPEKILVPFERMSHAHEWEQDSLTTLGKRIMCLVSTITCVPATATHLEP